MITFHVLTIFPDAFSSYLKTSVLGRAQKKKLIKVDLVDIRSFSSDRRGTVDDRPYGGGPGMVMKIEPIYKGVAQIKSRIKKKSRRQGTRVILFSTRGKPLNQDMTRRFSKYQNLILICGRYEGIDERVADYVADEEVSLGNYVLSGGELAALVVVEAVARHIPGVLGKYESLEEIKGSYPVYTRPEVFWGKTGKGKKQSWRTPSALVSGHHRKIKEWRKQL
ncbi:tRNA (guanosine(37)-N1)-methyltransferase TrmD [Candidatus Jorgensenbacteria bacterium]|nr:tRNA (guanosine(37)-N1)-methyltransferase TrmD [Candidatus Jorgensenbacteria bacterium]